MTKRSLCMSLGLLSACGTKAEEPTDSGAGHEADTDTGTCVGCNCHSPMSDSLPGMPLYDDESSGGPEKGMKENDAHLPAAR